MEIRNITFDGLIPALKTGTIDLIISSMTATEERARSIDFSDPYVFTGLAILAAGQLVMGQGELLAAARELAPEVRVNAVAPGLVETDLSDALRTSESITWRKSMASLPWPNCRGSCSRRSFRYQSSRWSWWMRTSSFKPMYLLFTE